ncbi:MAG: nucleotidyltransferase family protein [Nitrospirae bacterium]|nr:nucleotidyltransferase family protein [Nitrospirota bacterium]
MGVKKTIDIQKLIEICRRHKINYLAIFGSYARGDYSEKSDLDLLIRFSEEVDDEISLLDFVGIEQELSEEFQIKVDLLTEDSISPYIKKYIMDDLKVIYNEG